MIHREVANVKRTINYSYTERKKNHLGKKGPKNKGL